MEAEPRLEGNRVTSPGEPRAPSSWRSREDPPPAPLEGARPCPHLDLGLPASRPGTE